jgi:protein-S-isoprenylcysteine O-methyltransferase Ste14
MDAAMAYGLVLMVVGGLLILLGWLTLYKNIKKTGLVTQGIYSCSRHPQYLGFILIVLGWFFGWPTILTLAFTPILVYKYLKVCLEEEKEMEKGFPEYKKYRARTPFLV